MKNRAAGYTCRSVFNYRIVCVALLSGGGAGIGAIASGSAS